MSHAVYPLKFQIGARTLLSIPRRLIRTPLSLADALGSVAPTLPALAPGSHGHVVTSLPEAQLAAVIAQGQGLAPVIRQHYVRRFADLAQGMDAYLAGFSSKSRSTLLRKIRRFAERSGGTIDIRRYASEDEVDQFIALAQMVSEKSYQERLLDAGLPRNESDIAEMKRLARKDGLRAFILLLDGQPISYLYLPAVGGTLIYAYLGFDPEYGEYSPGAVLQLEAMRVLMAEGRFSLFDFTEGEGQHKRLFATDGVPCVDLMLLRPTFGNRAAFGALSLFDGAVATAKGLADRPLLRPLARAIRR